MPSSLAIAFAFTAAGLMRPVVARHKPMNAMDRRALSERDICTRFITPALRHAGRDEMLQIRHEVSFTKGRMFLHGKPVTRGQARRADYILCDLSPRCFPD